MRIANPRDFWAGLAVAVFGAAVSAYAATHYQLGTAVRMGPGYFPTWVGAILGLLGLALLIGALRADGPPLPRFHWRPILFILGGAIGYGYLLKPLGLVVSTIVAVVITAAGGYEFRWREALLLAAGLAVFSVGVFVYALGLPFPLWPEALE